MTRATCPAPIPSYVPFGVRTAADECHRPLHHEGPHWATTAAGGTVEWGPTIPGGWRVIR